MKRLICILLALVLVFTMSAVSAFAAYKEIPEPGTFPINDKYKVKGPYTGYNSETYAPEDTGLEFTYRVWYPDELKTTEELFPMIIFNNGTWANDDEPRYQLLFQHLVSWGFVVMSSNNESTGTGQSTEEGVNFFFETELQNPESIFYGKIDRDNVGVSGHSQGGSCTINTVSEGKWPHSGMYKAALTISTTWDGLAKSIFQNSEWDMSLVHCPIWQMATNGSLDQGFMIPKRQMSKSYGQVSSEEKIKAILDDGSDHNSWEESDSFFGYYVAWFQWHLRGDEFARGAFYGDDFELGKHPAWIEIETTLANYTAPAPEPEPSDPEPSGETDSAAPKIIEGADQKVQGDKDALFKSDAAFSTFEKVLVDDKEISKDDYTVAEGSTVVTLKTAFLKTLSAGNHTLSVVSSTGTAKTSFTVEAPVGNDTQKIANTGEPLVDAFSAVVIITGIFAAAVIIRKKILVA